MQGGLLMNSETFIGIAIVIVILLILIGAVILLTSNSTHSNSTHSNGEKRLSTWVIFKLLFIGELDEKQYPNHYVLKSLVYICWLIIVGSVVHTFIDILF